MKLTDEQLKRAKRSVKCFDNALDFLVEKAHERVDEFGTDFENYHFNFEYRLVHALCLHPSDRKLYAHAWVEDIKRGKAWFALVLDGVPIFTSLDIPVYHKLCGVIETSDFTLREAARENAAHNNYGPWNPRYKDHVATRTDAL